MTANDVYRVSALVGDREWWEVRTPGGVELGCLILDGHQHKHDGDVVLTSAARRCDSGFEATPPARVQVYPFGVTADTGWRRMDTACRQAKHSLRLMYFHHSIGLQRPTIQQTLQLIGSGSARVLRATIAKIARINVAVQEESERQTALRNVAHHLELLVEFGREVGREHSIPEMTLSRWLHRLHEGDAACGYSKPMRE